MEDIGEGYFSIIADEFTDISNKEQLSIVLRWIDEELDPQEDFIGFFHIPNIAADTLKRPP